MKPTPLNPDYTAFLTDVKGRIQTARLQVGRAVNRELVLLYWDIGRGIVERQKVLGWGDAVVERFATDLRAEFPDMHGFSRANVWRMRQFYETCTSPDFLAQLARELPKSEPAPATADFLAQAARELAAALPWWHHVELMAKIKDPAARLYYLRATAQFGSSRSVLLNQIKGQAHERAVKEKKTHNFDVALPEHFPNPSKPASSPTPRPSAGTLCPPRMPRKGGRVFQPAAFRAQTERNVRPPLPPPHHPSSSPPCSTPRCGTSTFTAWDMPPSPHLRPDNRAFLFSPFVLS
jgi:predicted nuclease of restriction endonuclease-like (RecB) superfamily